MSPAVRREGAGGVDTGAAAWAGLLPVDKPSGRTSHDVVARARRRIGLRAVGHLGTLDPSATGLLVLVIGAATRCAAVWQGGDKEYEGRARFGVVTDSQDLDGRTLEERPVAFTAEALRDATPAFVGELRQVPPMVSAIKVGGRRLHELARRGEEVAREPRTVHVSSWRWTDVTLPEASFVVRCSGGTYVRTLVHDLGAALGSGAALASLRRRRSEPFGVDEAAPWAALDAGDPAELLDRWGVTLDRALETLPAVTLDAARCEAVGRGQRPAVSPAPGVPVGGGPRSVVLRDTQARALALGELLAEGDRIIACPHVVFPWAVREGRSA